MMQQEPITSQTVQKPKRNPEKITQMQCYETNIELMQFFIESLNQSFKYLPNILSKIYLELEMVLGFIEYRLTIAVGDPHPGDVLQNLRYCPQSLTQTKKLIYLFLTVILPYIKKRLYNYMLDDPSGWKEKLLKALNIIDKIMSIANFINYAVFLYKGKYRCITQRILKISVQFINQENSRILNFTLMNRKIIWGIYELFLKTMLPFIHGYFTKALKNVFYLSSYLEVDDAQPNCVYCGETASMTMVAKPCKHLACYYCVMNSSNFEAEKPQKCQKCGQEIEKWDRTY